MRYRLGSEGGESETWRKGEIFRTEQRNNENRLKRIKRTTMHMLYSCGKRKGFFLPKGNLTRAAHLRKLVVEGKGREAAYKTCRKNSDSARLDGKGRKGETFSKSVDRGSLR